MEATQVMRFEETELRLGLPGNAAVAAGNGGVRKRGFSETETMDLQLNLSSSSTTATKLDAPPCAAAAAGKLLDASPPPPAADHQNQMEKSLLQADPAKPPAKKNMVQAAAAVKKSTTTINAGKEKEAAVSAAESEVAAGSFVKVSMDGAPYLRKVDLKMYASYKQLSDALAKMFNSFSTNEAAAGAGAGGMKDFMGENNSSAAGDDYVPTYEDKDGDWMLVGDVPWEMFVVSCKRLRIMKGKDAIIGLAPRGMEKRKNRA
ncbi:unnamed protein product [Linum tenue]|uniref:Auxin-responsive protein n=1 Tax=Linum tenue TaxID=586396 RepID=A0AAV0LIY3_9ROSI|nr:unnamed protein product [Linum tenue]